MAQRALAAAWATAIAAGTVRPALFFEGEYETGTLNLWSGIGPITWDSKVWTGAGDMLIIDPVTERSDITAVGFSVSLAGDVAAVQNINTDAARQGLPGRVWLGGFDASDALIADPYKVFEGRLDMPHLSDDGETCKITVNYESRLIDLDRTRERRYTMQDQQTDYPTDTGMRFVTELQNKEITWGRPGGAPAGSGSSAGSTATGVADVNSGSGGEAGGAGGVSGGDAGSYDGTGFIEGAAPGSISMGDPYGGAAPGTTPDPGVNDIENASPGDISFGSPEGAIEYGTDPGAVEFGGGGEGGFW